MRIISGTRKGYLIKAPQNLPIRPITDRSKESLFNILVNRVDIEGIRVLDLFSGSGSISLEFASRGAGPIAAVDLHPGCVDFLKTEAKKLGFDQIETHRSDVLAFVRNIAEPYDIIFADPPYAFSEEQYRELIAAVVSPTVMGGDSLFIIEHHSVNNFSDIAGFGEKRAYGQNVLSFFELPEREGHA